MHGAGTEFGPDSSATADWAGLAGVGQLHISTAGLQHFGAPGHVPLAWEIRQVSENMGRGPGRGGDWSSFESWELLL